MSSRRILIVDDQPHVIRVIRRGLERQGYEVASAGDGAEALERLAESRFDVMITHLEMPRLDGLSLCEAARSDHQGSVELILLVTGKTDAEPRERVEQLQSTEFIEKPVSLRSLSDRLERHFTERG